MPTTDGGFHPSKRQVAGAVIGVLALVFILQNSRKATLRFLFFSVTTPVWIAFLLVLCAGAIVGYVGRGIIQSRRAAAKDPAP